VRDADGRAVIGAVVAIAGTRLAAQTDGQGRFVIPAVPATDVSVRARRIGFRPDTSRASVTAGAATELRITLERTAFDLTPVLVEGHRNVTGPMAGFYRRAEQGQGRYFTAELIERRGYITITDLLRSVPGARIERGSRNVPYVRFRGSTSPPQIFIDGVPLSGRDMDLNSIIARNFAGIEVYSGFASVPAEFSTSRILGGSGGVILLWTREGEARRRRSRRGEGSAAELVARMLDAAQVYTADQVDRPAVPDPADPVRPLYPDSLYAMGISGEVMVELVVDAEGSMRPETFNLVTATHPAFGEAVRRAMLDQRFVPAMRAGDRVSQIVQMPFSFRPDAAMGARERPD
jgi:TonB family protein